MKCFFTFLFLDTCGLLSKSLFIVHTFSMCSKTSKPHETQHCWKITSIFHSWHHRLWVMPTMWSTSSPSVAVYLPSKDVICFRWFRITICLVGIHYNSDTSETELIYVRYVGVDSFFLTLQTMNNINSEQHLGWQSIPGITVHAFTVTFKLFLNHLIQKPFMSVT